MAWLHATPKPPEGSKGAAVKQPPQPTRIAAMKAKKQPVCLPPNPMPHLVNWLTEIGLSEAAGMGAVPLSWATIEAWQRVTGVSLAPWEARLIRALSAAHLSESREAESTNRPAPWSDAPTPDERKIEVDQLRSVLG